MGNYRFITMLLVLVACISIICGVIINENVAYADNSSTGEVWIQSAQTYVYYSNLNAIITVKIKNTASNVQYFKISQVYTGSLVDNSTIKWLIDWTNPTAVKMLDAASPELGGDYGWKIQPGETKTVTFKVSATGPMGDIPTYIYNTGSIANTYWPLIPDPGTYASWFQPNEIEQLNPSLDLESWKGTFNFKLSNHDSSTVSGIVRAPVVPTDSVLTYSDPKATYTDHDLVANTGVAAWDVTMGAGGSQWYTYTYAWPSGSSNSNTGKASYSVPKNSSTSNPPVSTQQTGVPYGLFAVGAVLAAGGLVFSRFMR